MTSEKTNTRWELKAKEMKNIAECQVCLFAFEEGNTFVSKYCPECGAVLLFKNARDDVRACHDLCEAKIIRLKPKSQR